MSEQEKVEREYPLIRPCKHCGQMPEQKKAPSGYFYMACPKDIGMPDCFDLPIKAIQAWNKRME